MNQVLLWLILLGTAATIALAIVLLVLMSKSFQGAGSELRDELRAGREEARAAGKELRGEVSSGLQMTHTTLSDTLEAMANAQQTQLEGMAKQLNGVTESSQGALDRIRDAFDTRAKDLQDSNEKKLQDMRKEVAVGLQLTNDTLSRSLAAMEKSQHTQIEGMTTQLKELAASNQGALDRISSTFDARIKQLQEGNERKLEEMRKTVDEKLHDTLEKRLGESFKLVSDRLEAVHKGLGEMQTLATGVGDLKRVLTNVKARGTWAEVQLGGILEQILTPAQYEKNVRVKAESLGAVEFAVRLPGPKDDPEMPVWLPIDSKFPQEDYLRLQEAAEKAEPERVAKATDALVKTIRAAAKDIHQKYINPPNTTDFGVMFMATEGLYAELLRQPGLVEDLLHEYRVVVAGPTTLAAMLSSLRMGFQTLAIEQRAAEVWKVLGAVKTEFGKFGDVLDRVKRQLNTASRTIDETDVRTRVMERKLRSVEELPAAEASRILELPEPSVGAETEELEAETVAQDVSV